MTIALEKDEAQDIVDELLSLIELSSVLLAQT